MSSADPALRPVHWLLLAGLFVLALAPRRYSAQSLGWHWDGSGSFTLINFDEAGSCRAALDGFDYSPFIGLQTIAISEMLGNDVPAGTVGDYSRVRAYCHGPEHLLVARSYSAILGAATVVLLGVMGWLLAPGQPRVGLTAAALLALSGFHISESHSGTVDAPSVFFIYLFLLALVLAIARGWRGLLLASPVLLVAAVWTKYWLFAVFAYASVIPRRAWAYASTGFETPRLIVLVLALCVLFGLVTNADFQATGWYPLLALFYLAIPWRRVPRAMIPVWLAVPLLAFALTRVELFANFTTGEAASNFGTGYAAIGWNKWLRNPVNVVAVLIVGLGIPAALCLPAGIRYLAQDRAQARLWLCLLPVLVFALFMAFLAPVTYYRHYLALIPAAALLAALGFWQLGIARRPWALALFLLWPALLAVDLESDYHADPRIELRQWYQEARPQRVFMSFYVAPPAEFARGHVLFKPEYAAGDAQTLRQAQYLVLSENWYDTAFANELNGPYVGNLQRLIKTTPEYTRFYRRALAGEHPYLEPVRRYDVVNFMPELVLHKWLYGTFQMFVGDIVVFSVRSQVSVR